MKAGYCLDGLMSRCGMSGPRGTALQQHGLPCQPVHRQAGDVLDEGEVRLGAFQRIAEEDMFGIGSTEFLVILLVALVVLGPKSLASVSRTLGKAMGEFRRVSTDFQRTLNAEVEQEEHLKRKQEAEKEFFSPEARAEHAAKTAAQAQATAQPAASQPQAAPAAAPAATETAARPAVQPEVVPSAAPVPPADSPLAQALAKAQTEAGSDATPASGAKA